MDHRMVLIATARTPFPLTNLGVEKLLRERGIERAYSAIAVLLYDGFGDECIPRQLYFLRPPEPPFCAVIGGLGEEMRFFERIVAEALARGISGIDFLWKGEEKPALWKRLQEATEKIEVAAV